VDLIWLLLTLLALLALFPNLASLVQGLRFHGHVRRARRMAFGAFLPRLVLILPVRGLDEGFDANVRSILSQSYPRFRLIAVADDLEDPALARIREISREFPRIPLTPLVSEPTLVPGKVNALRSALAHLEKEDEVVAFADSDIRPAPDWLRQLVQPLADSTVGVATGFRWYVPTRPTFWSLVRAEWNAVSANILFDPRRSFAWGGSCAMRTDLLPRLRLEERWRNVLSDDLILTQAVRDAGLKIAYVPAALVPTLEDANRKTCIEWCFRQMTMATLYLPVARRYAVAAFSIIVGSLLFAVTCIVLAAAWGPAYLIPAALFSAPVPTAVAKSSLRRNALFSAAPVVAASWRVSAWRTAIAAMAVPWVMSAGLVKTRRPAVVHWRGRAYDVRDPRHVSLVK
jgi:cellulose synthase/poly-beta-1,6-N-acetylglucosamine synthase-like glycosyltransferase